MVADMHALCQAARTGSKSITDYPSWKAWRRRYWRPIMRLHTTTFGPMRDLTRNPKPVMVPASCLEQAGWRFYKPYKQPGYWLSPSSSPDCTGNWYVGTRDGLQGLKGPETK